MTDHEKKACAPALVQGREEARRAGMDNITGNREKYRDPTMNEAMRELCRPPRKKPGAKRTLGVPYTGPDIIPIVTRVLNPDGTVTDYPIKPWKE